MQEEKNKLNKELLDQNFKETKGQEGLPGSKNVLNVRNDLKAKIES